MGAGAWAVAVVTAVVCFLSQLKYARPGLPAFSQEVLRKWKNEVKLQRKVHCPNQVENSAGLHPLTPFYPCVCVSACVCCVDAVGRKQHRTTKGKLNLLLLF